MKVRVESKWAFIARICSERGYDKAERLAYEIDAALISLYGPLNTVQWVVAMEKIQVESGIRDMSDEEIYAVANSAPYCIACQVQSRSDGCQSCAFGKMCGRCNHPHSLFLEFLNMFENYMKIEEEEEE